MGGFIHKSRRQVHAYPSQTVATCRLDDIVDIGPKRRSYRAKRLKNWKKLRCLPNQTTNCSIWRFRGFWRGRMERKYILRRNRPRVSNFLSHRTVGFFKNHAFWLSWKVPSSPNDPWTSRWVIQIFYKHQRLLAERPSAKIHFEKLPPKQNMFLETGQPHTIIILL